MIDYRRHHERRRFMLLPHAMSLRFFFDDVRFHADDYFAATLLRHAAPLCRIYTE